MHGFFGGGIPPYAAVSEGHAGKAWNCRSMKRAGIDSIGSESNLEEDHAEETGCWIDADEDPLQTK